jgi:hypothetical protein
MQQKRKRMPSVCEHCGRDFMGRVDPPQRFCGRQCVDLNQKGPVIDLVCEQCGCEFESRAYRQPRYCSRSCKDISQRTRGIDLVCEQCGRTYQARAFDAPIRRYCSRACYWLGRFGPLEGRFDANVDRVTEAPCWVWTAALNRHGYGSIGAAYYGEGLAHRYAYARAKGPIPPGLFVRHLCGVPRCVNPEHLAVGTAQDNSNDEIERRRQRAVYWNSKLTATDIIAIRRLGERVIKHSVIAELFGISGPSVTSIIYRKTHLNVPPLDRLIQAAREIDEHQPTSSTAHLHSARRRARAVTPPPDSSMRQLPL